MNHIKQTRTVEISTEGLISALESNLKVHDEVYEEAVNNYWKELKKTFDEEVEEARELIAAEDISNGAVHISISISPPQNRSEEYKNVIAMFKAEVKKTVEITQREFEMYVLNKWDWVDQFLVSNSRYASAGTVGKFKGG